MHSRTGHQNAARLVTAVSTTVAVLAALTAVAAPAQVAGPAIPGVSTTRSPSTVAGLAPSGSTPATPTATPLAAVWPIPENGQLHRKIGEVRTGPSPKQVAFSPDGTELWVPLLGAVGIDVYRVPTLERIARIPLGTKGGVEVIFTRDGSRAYVSQMHTSSVYEIDRVAKRVIRILTTKGNWTKQLAC